MGNIWVLAEAIQYAVDEQQADIINMSLATPRRTHLLGSVLSSSSDSLPQPGEEDFPVTHNPNLVIVAAAGNQGDSTFSAAGDMGVESPRLPAGATITRLGLCVSGKSSLPRCGNESENVYTPPPR